MAKSCPVRHGLQKLEIIHYFTITSAVYEVFKITDYPFMMNHSIILTEMYISTLYIFMKYHPPCI